MRTTSSLDYTKKIKKHKFTTHNTMASSWTSQPIRPHEVSSENKEQKETPKSSELSEKQAQDLAETLNDPAHTGEQEQIEQDKAEQKTLQDIVQPQNEIETWARQQTTPDAQTSEVKTESSENRTVSNETIQNAWRGQDANSLWDRPEAWGASQPEYVWPTQADIWRNDKEREAIAEEKAIAEYEALQAELSKASNPSHTTTPQHATPDSGHEHTKHDDDLEEQDETDRDETDQDKKNFLQKAWSKVKHPFVRLSKKFKSLFSKKD